MLSIFNPIHSVAALSLCALMASLAALTSLWTDREKNPLRAALRSPGRESAEDYYY